MADANYWYEHAGGQAGPVSAAQLKAMAASGELKPEHMIWKEGMPEWVPASSFKGLFNSAAPPATPSGAPLVGPPVPPPTSDQPVGPPPPTGDFQRQAAQAAQVAREASQQAMGAVRILLSDPIGGLAKAYESLGPTKALPVGIVFLVAYFACYLIGGILTPAPLLMIPWVSFQSIGSLLYFHSLSYFQGIFLLALFVGALIGAWVLMRVVLKRSANFAADLFVVSTALLPQGVVSLAVLILSRVLQGGWIVSAIYMGMLILAHCWLVFLLFSGLTKVVGLTERMAGLVIPAIFTVAVLIVLCVQQLFVSSSISDIQRMPPPIQTARS